MLLIIWLEEKTFYRASIQGFKKNRKKTAHQDLCRLSLLIKQDILPDPGILLIIDNDIVSLAASHEACR